MASTIVACLALSAGGDALGHLSFEDFAAHANTTAGAEDLAKHETQQGPEPELILEDVLSVLCWWSRLQKIEQRWGSPSLGSRRPELPTMMLPSEQNPGELSNT